MKKLENGKLIDCTPEEIAQRRAEISTWEAGASARQKQKTLDEMDKDMPRALEDVIDALPGDVRSRIAAQTLARYQAKKQARGD